MPNRMPLSLNGDDVRAGLLRHNYFPDQTEQHDELPPCFGSDTFSDTAARRLLETFPNVRLARKGGYDETAVRLTRHDLVPRVASIPHPVPYVHLVEEIASNWDEISFIETNTLSEVRPRKRSEDARIIIRGGYDEYEEDDLDDEDGLRAEHPGADLPLPADSIQKFLVQADISNFFPSIYTHSVPWALVGRAVAKDARGDDAYFNRIDRALQATRRGETKGISIGPGTSNIVAESILTRIDMSLSNRFTYTRYIDDYTLFSSSEEDGRQFIESLEHELGEFRLSLNPRKTKILALPRASDDPWVNQLKLFAPGQGDESRIGPFLDLAISLGQDFPDGSTIKYAARRLLSNFDEGAAPEWFLDRLIGLAFHRPVLLPLLRESYESSSFLTGRHSEVLVKIGLQAARYRRSDVLCWVLYYFGKAGLELDDSLVEFTLESRDPMALTILADVGDAATLARIIQLVSELDRDHPQDLDRFWVLLQMLHSRNLIRNPYRQDSTMKILREEGVSFYSRIEPMEDPFGWDGF